MDIGVWLRELGLERYERAFREGDIDAEVLPDLTEADLEELGVSLGHRKKLLKAIARLGRPSDAPPANAPPETAPVPRRRREAGHRGERRHLTVLFCDLADSTELAARLDPEDMAEVLRAYHACCLDVITRWEGHLARFIGDGVLAFFGYPQAHEDDAERAVHAGLELVQAVRALATVPGTALRARVGIATGLVMAGALTGDARDDDVIGDTPNLAARLQTLAAPATVVISHGTRRLLGGTFTLASLGQQQLKGFAEPVEVWRADGVRHRIGGRFEARSIGQLTPFTGREKEIALLLRRWQRAKAGRGQVVLLCGEAGIGKSRIVRALQERLAAERYTALHYHCSPYYVTSAWHPVINQLERAAGFQDQDDATARVDKLEALLSLSAGDVGAVAPLFASLLSIDTGERYPPLNLTPQQTKARTIEVLHAQLEALAAQSPVLVTLEDAHWIDATTKELFDSSIGRLRCLPVLVVVTFRPYFATSWESQPHVSLLTLARLDRHRAAAMISGLTEHKELPAELVEQIVSKADGVPLFLEELTKAVLESGIVAEAEDGYALTGLPLTVGIPSTLQDSLMARLDRLAAVKEVAQIGAVIGREFPYDLLAKAAHLDQAELQRALRQLTASELIFKREGLPGPSYCFKHALVRDAAYDSLLRSRRQVLHARVARVLEQDFPARVEFQPELLAQHYAGAGMAERAIDCWIKAGRRAIERSALVEAAQHLTFGLRLLQQLPLGEDRDRRELAIQSALGPALLVSRGYAAAEVETAFARMRELCERLGDRRELFLALRGLWAFRFVRAELHTATEVATELLQIAEEENDVAFRLEAHRAFGMTMLYLGDFESTRIHLGQGASLYDPEQHHAHAFRYGNDPGVVCLSYGAKALWCLGRTSEAAARSEEALQLAHRLKHPFSQTQAHTLAAMLCQHARELGSVVMRAEVAISSSAEYSFPYWHAIGMILRGWARVQQGTAGDALDEIQRGLTDYRATGATLAVPWFLALEAEARGRAKDIERGLALLAEAETLAENTGETYYLAEICRLRGELVWARGLDKADDAEAAFRRSLEIACRQKAKSWELRTSTSLSRILAAAGRRKEALDVLGPICTSFADTPAGADLREARMLLATLT